MILGAFSISLAVNDIEVSRAFYEKLGFEVTGGDQEQRWLILRNGETTLGMFQGMFDRNTLTFNPGLIGSTMETLEDFEDVRAIQAELQDRGIEILSETAADGEGPGHIVLVDPDGNPILIDQHV